MADRIPPAQLAHIDQAIAECNRRLDQELRAVRRLIAEEGRQEALMQVTGAYSIAGMHTAVACTLAVAVVRLAEAEEADRG
ncbi:hypothetical protein [Saccharothrix sp. HUAS TT1]|uniref:hypothetical protein n=1 Tax=unclassified Saccharothrix TaxID=2593673 RepID=UPI00345B9BB8